jgi:hypothetical protein
MERGRIKTDVSMDLGLIVVFRFCLLPIQKRKGYWITRHYNFKTFTRATVLYDGGQFEIADPFQTTFQLGYCFAPVGSLNKFNTFLLKQKINQ